MTADLDVLIAGGGPVGATLALTLASSGLAVRLAEPSARPAPRLRPIALSHASRLILDRVGAFAPLAVTPIGTIHVSQAGGFGRTVIRSADHGVPALGYVTDLGGLAETLLQAARSMRIAARVTQWTSRDGLIHATLADDAGEQALTAKLLVCADGGPAAASDIDAQAFVARDYGQAAIVAAVTTEAAPAGVAWERFTAEGPLALLPFGERYALVWTVAAKTAPALMELADAAFLAALSHRFGARLGRFTSVADRVAYPVGLRYRRSNAAGPHAVAIGNAAQTLHPVAGQGLNLGLRDAFELGDLIRGTPVHELGDGAFAARFRRMRRNDRYASIGVTDLLARVFANDDPVLALARGAGLALLDTLPPARRFLARRMMFGARGLP